jgi:transposase-like protein
MGFPFVRAGLVKNGSIHGQKQVLCRVCGQSVTVRYGTAYWDLNARAVIFETVIRALTEGNSLRSTARIVQVDKDTACDGLDRAAQRCRQVLCVMVKAGVRILGRGVDLDSLCAGLKMVLPHESLRQPLSIPEPTRGQGSKRRWTPVIPTMAARITDHVWTTNDK